MGMRKWVVAGLLVTQAHFSASYLVPLDEPAQRTFGGSLKWVWPWSVGDRGPFGRMMPPELPLPGLWLALSSAGLLFIAALAAVGIWIPSRWWRALSIVGAVLSALLMTLFPGPTKILPIGSALAVLAVASRWRNDS